MSQQENESRSTAYVFGELSKEETAEFEQELERSTDLQSEVASIREAVVALQAEFDSESTSVNIAGRKKIEQAMSGTTAPSATKPNSTELNKTESRSGGRRLFLGLATAASLLVIVGLVYPKLSGKEEASKKLASAVKQEASAIEEQAGSSEDGSSYGGGGAQSTSRVASGRKTVDRTAPMYRTNTREAGKKLDADVALTDLESKLAAGALYGDVAAPAAPMPRLSESARNSPAKSPAPAQPVAESPHPGGAVSKEAYALSIATPTPSDESAPAPHPTAGQQLSQQSRPEVRFRQNTTVMTAIEKQKQLGRRRVVAGAELTEMSEMMLEPGRGIGPQLSGDRHDVIEDNPFMEVKNEPLSTFSIDVDTAAYAKVRMYLMQQNSMPRPDAVRIEEMLNYFTYDYAPPEDDHPFAASMEVAACPWNAKHRLARIGIKGKAIEQDRPSSNLVFLLDVSGSMNRPNKHPLVVEGMKMLVDQLSENDSVAVVVYAGAAGLVLDSTTGDKKQTIIESLERLRAGGSTNGGQGITLAYQIARDNFITGGTNRVILCSDGDFNVGVTGTDELVQIAEQNAKSNIFLSVLGFGMGNHNDSMMEQISNKGNGNYAFIDTKAEARKVLVEEMGATLVTIAKDVKIQVEFNPKEVSAYRLIGYENRMLAAQDFNDDKKDAGEIGAGHTVTALYELVPAGVDSNVTVPPVDDLVFQKKMKLSQEAESGVMLMLKLRYKQPEGTKSTLIKFPVSDSGKSFTKTDPDFQFAASVAAFGMLLRNSPHKGDATYAGVEEIAQGGISDDPGGYRAEFLQMVARAKELSGE